MKILQAKDCWQKLAPLVVELVVGVVTGLYGFELDGNCLKQVISDDNIILKHNYCKLFKLTGVVTVCGTTKTAVDSPLTQNEVAFKT